MINYYLTIRIKKISPRATQCKIVFANKVVVSAMELTEKMTSVKTVGIPVLSTCLSVNWLDLETVHA